jgi:hypothetical protein
MQVRRAARHDTYVGPTTVSLVFDNFLMVASGRPKWALTRSGGVKASHWFKETSWKTPIQVNQINMAASQQATQHDPWSALTRFIDFEVRQRSITSVFDVMTYWNQVNLSWLSE